MAWGIISSDHRPVWPVGRKAKLMPIGDSITRGQGAVEQGGYRGPLLTALRAAGKDIDFVGSRTVPAPASFQAEGGWRIQDHVGWGSRNLFGINSIDAARTAQPDIIVIHIGTNNTGATGVGASALAAYMGTYSQLLDGLYDAVPFAHVFNCRNILREDRWTGTTTYNNAMQSLVEGYITQGRPYHVLTGLEAVPNGSWTDGLHPNPSGYNFMSNVIGTELLSHI